MKMFVTFGAGQYGGALANHYIEFEADGQTARRLMHEFFGPRWASIYTEQEFEGQPERYGLMRLCKMDDHGNILARGLATLGEE